MIYGNALLSKIETVVDNSHAKAQSRKESFLVQVFTEHFAFDNKMLKRLFSLASWRLCINKS
jgi:hypothetical protein